MQKNDFILFFLLQKMQNAKVIIEFDYFNEYDDKFAIKEFGELPKNPIVFWNIGVDKKDNEPKEFQDITYDIDFYSYRSVCFGKNSQLSIPETYLSIKNDSYYWNVDDKIFHQVGRQFFADYKLWKNEPIFPYDKFREKLNTYELITKSCHEEIIKVLQTKVENRPYCKYNRDIIHNSIRDKIINNRDAPKIPQYCTYLQNDVKFSLDKNDNRPFSSLKKFFSNKTPEKLGFPTSFIGTSDELEKICAQHLSQL